MCLRLLSFGRKSAVQNDYLKEELVLLGKSFRRSKVWILKLVYPC